MKKLDGKITISRWTGNGEQKHGISISVEDVNSGCEVIHIDMTVEEFAQCMFGSSYQDCKIKVPENFEILGKYPIRKTIWVKYDSYERDSNKVLQFAKDSVKEFEVDGWRYSHHQLGNSHYRSKDKSGKYPVSMIKFVDTVYEKACWDSKTEEHNVY